MQESKPIKKVLTIVFISVEILLYLAFLIIDLFRYSYWSTIIKYVSIILCFIASFLLLFDGKKEKNYYLDNVLVTIALAFTLIADTFLLLLSSNISLGVASFIVVQALYLFRLFELGKKNIVATVVIRVVICCLALITLKLINMLVLTNALAVIYFINIVLNTVDCYFLPDLYGKKNLFAIGLTLFTCCDICVGLFNLNGMIMLDKWLLDFATYSMWLFYLPSQVLIVLSSITNGKEKNT